MTSAETTIAAADPKAASAVYYDGACPICRREIAVYEKMTEDAVRFEDVSESAPHSAEAPPLDRETLLARFHARRANGELVSGAAAFLAVWRAAPRLAWVAKLLDRQPFLWVGDRLYALFLLVRPLWRKPSAATSARGSTDRD